MCQLDRCAYSEPDFGPRVGGGDVVDGLVAGVHPEGAHAGAGVVAVALLHRHVVGALHGEVALRELHLREPGGEVVAAAGGHGDRHQAQDYQYSYYPHGACRRGERDGRWSRGSTEEEEAMENGSKVVLIRWIGGPDQISA